jgi:hypothetical protein
MDRKQIEGFWMSSFMVAAGDGRTMLKILPFGSWWQTDEK